MGSREIKAGASLNERKKYAALCFCYTEILRVGKEIHREDFFNHRAASTLRKFGK